MKSDDRIVLTAKEAAKYLGISLATLHKIEAEGALLPSRTPGGHRRYSSEMLESYFEKSRRNHTTQESQIPRDAAGDGTLEEQS